jgi:hypothetical protein
MALKDITSQQDLVAEANRTRQKRVEEGNKARAAQREEASKINNLRERRQSMNIAYNQFKNSGTEGIDTEPGMIEKLFGATENSPKYQAAREMKSALEHERARANVPNALDEVRSSGETKLKKGGTVKAKKMASGGKVSQLAKANGIAVRGKSRGRIV